MTSPIDPPANPYSPRLAGGNTPQLQTASAAQTRFASLRWIPTWIILISLSAAAASFLTIATRTGHGFFVPILATAICILAALFDGFTTRIPNPLTYTTIVLGLAINLVAMDLAHYQWTLPLTWLAAPGITQSLLGLAVCVPLALLALLFRVGGGDLKLMVGLGALLGLSQLGYVMMIALAIAGVYGLINLVAFGRLNNFVRVISLRGLEMFFLRRFSRLEVSDERLTGSQVPMAIPLAIGLILAQVFTIQKVLGGGVGP